MLKKFLKLLLNQKGQMLALYALLVPVLFAVGGTAVDLGWYYFNASRLQNMADAAIMASSKVLTGTDGEFSNYRYNYILPYAPKDLTPEDRNSESGDLEAKKYISKNLEISSEWSDGNIVTDTFSDVNLTFKKETFPTKDADNYPILYYEITLTETPNHLFSFLEKFLDKKTISAKAAAKFTHVPDSEEETGPSLFDQMEAIKKDKVYDYWEVIQHEYEVELAGLQEDMKNEIANGADKAEVLQRYIDQLTAKYMERGVNKSTAISRAKLDLDEKEKTRYDRSGDKARERSVTTSGNYWLKDLTSYRTENMTLRGKGGPAPWNENQTDFDDLFINALQDVRFNFEHDWDITEPLPEGMKAPDDFVLKYCGIFDGNTKRTFGDNENGIKLSKEYDPGNVRFFYRIFALIGVEEERDKPKGTFPYKVREGRDKYDPLFARIESEPIKWEPYYGGGHKEWNSVRQFFINVNCANSKEGVDRPIIFFYDGPRKIDENSHIRDSKPIIFNLNADFRGVIYAPNSPVVVVGNNHSFEGFIVAKKFINLKTADEIKADGYNKIVKRCEMPLVQFPPDPEPEPEPSDGEGETGGEGDNESNNSGGSQSTTETPKVDKNQPIIDYNQTFNSNKRYVANEIFVKNEEDIIEAADLLLLTNDPAEIVKDYIAVTYSGRTCYIRRDCDYFEKVTNLRADSSYNPVKIPVMFVDNKGNVAFSDEVFATVEGEDKTKYTDVADQRFSKDDFKLKSSTFNNFFIVKFVNYTYLNREGSLDNFFITERSKKVY